MKLDKTVVGPRRSLFLLLSALLATLFVLGSVQWIAAQEDEPSAGDEPAKLMPDKSAIYKDRMLPANEIERLQSPVERYIALESISGDQLVGSDLSNSSKEVNFAEVAAGSQVQFTIVISNSGDADALVTMTDTLPAELVYRSHELQDSFNALLVPGFTVGGNQVTWSGTVGGGGYAQIAIVAEVKDNVPAGTMVSNAAQISDGGQSVSPVAGFRVLAAPETSDWSLPLVVYGIKPDPPDVTNLAATRPNSQNQFTLSWTGGPNASRYEVQMDQDPGFASPGVHDAGLSTSVAFKPEPSFHNDFYFRVRSFEGPIAGKWSDTVNVVGAYRDDFEDTSSGWKIVRTTNLDHVKSFYEFPPNNTRWLIMDVGDKWDWGISSPLAKAPEPPYVIEYDGKFAQTPNEVAMGIVFGADLVDEACPDTTNSDTMYRHENCFNHFYNPQYYWAGEALHLLWYRTDELIWCRECSGSPMKRRGESVALGEMSGVDNDDWNRHRIEVREGSIKYFAGRPSDVELKLQYEYHDTRYIHEPYFGVFAYAGEYTSSIARFEYFAITPLDN
jgi:uncharacterized repeat protein (TIGR01451 family)